MSTSYEVLIYLPNEILLTTPLPVFVSMLLFFSDIS